MARTAAAEGKIATSGSRWWSTGSLATAPESLFEILSASSSVITRLPAKRGSAFDVDAYGRLGSPPG
jgi:hypothetical protein